MDAAEVDQMECWTAKDLLAGRCQVEDVGQPRSPPVDTPMPQFDYPQASLSNIRSLEVARLDKATTALMPKVETGDLNAINTMLKIQARRAALIGLDAPKEVVTKNFSFEFEGGENLDRLTTTQLKALLLRTMREQGTITEGEYETITSGQPLPDEP